MEWKRVYVANALAPSRGRVQHLSAKRRVALAPARRPTPAPVVELAIEGINEPIGMIRRKLA